MFGIKFIKVQPTTYLLQYRGGKIVRDIQNTDYGSREFTVKDPEGHSWSVGTYNPWASHS